MTMGKICAMFMQRLVVCFSRPYRVALLGQKQLSRQQNNALTRSTRAEKKIPPREILFHHQPQEFPCRKKTETARQISLAGNQKFCARWQKKMADEHKEKPHRQMFAACQKNPAAYPQNKNAAEQKTAAHQQKLFAAQLFCLGG